MKNRIRDGRGRELILQSEAVVLRREIKEMKIIQQNAAKNAQTQQRPPSIDVGIPVADATQPERAVIAGPLESRTVESIEGPNDSSSHNQPISSDAEVGLISGATADVRLSHYSLIHDRTCPVYSSPWSLHWIRASS